MPDVKRQNYSTGQFLTAADFAREQTYHLSLRRLHNQNLHTPGVAAGLELTKVDDTHLSISPGMAIDKQGRDIVLPDAATIDLSGRKPDARYIVAIAYGETRDAADKIRIGGSDAYRATTERPTLTLVETDGENPLTAMPADAVPLGLIGLDGGKLASVRRDQRQAAASLLPSPFAVPSLQTGTLEATNWITAGYGAIRFGDCQDVMSTPAEFSGSAGIVNHPTLGGLAIFGRSVPNAWSDPLGQTRWVHVHNYLVVYGTVYISPSAERPADLTVSGNLYVGGRSVLGAKSGYVMDRFVNRLGETLEAGDVVVIGNGSIGHYGEGERIPVPEVDLADTAYDTRVCGIVCEVHGETTDDGNGPHVYTTEERAGIDLNRVAPGQLGHMVTLGAYAVCKVDADIAAILPGDLLTTSPTRGHAQKVLDRSQAIGAIIGKALSGLERGRGIVPVMVMLQ